jgi:hypothetical protein
MKLSNKYLVITMVLLMGFVSVNAQTKTALHITSEIEIVPSLKSAIEQNGSAVLTAINEAFFSNKKPKFNPGNLEPSTITGLLSMWEMSEFRCYEAMVVEKVLEMPRNRYMIRNIPIFMKQAPEDDQYQEVVLIFTSTGKLDDIYISLESNRYIEILQEGNDVTDFRRRQQMLDFIENFRTSYNRKDINFLEKVFSEDALIITGKVIKKQEGGNNASHKHLNEETVKYQHQTKEEYIQKLKSIFKSNNYLNIEFDSLSITQHPKFSTIYGVTLKQTWSSSRYSDVGYVFLMIDFTDEDNPLIHIRTWQPEKYNGKVLPEDERFKLNNFDPAVGF